MLHLWFQRLIIWSPSPLRIICLSLFVSIIHLKFLRSPLIFLKLFLFFLLIDAENEKTRRIGNTDIHHINSNRYCWLRLLFAFRIDSNQYNQIYPASGYIKLLLLQLFSKTNSRFNLNYKTGKKSLVYTQKIIIYYENPLHMSHIKWRCAWFYTPTHTFTT